MHVLASRGAGIVSPACYGSLSVCFLESEANKLETLLSLINRTNGLGTKNLAFVEAEILCNCVSGVPNILPTRTFPCTVSIRTPSVLPGYALRDIRSVCPVYDTMVCLQLIAGVLVWAA